MTTTDLRPTGLDDFVGQPDLISHLRIILGAAKARGEAPAHMLFAGPAGLGKTSLAGVVATELGSKVHNLFAPTIKDASELATTLLSLEANDVLFIDEIHALGRAIEEVLYAAIEDFHIDIMVGKGSKAHAVRIELPPFTLVGATTLPGKISAPLRDRFGFVGRLDFYSAEELAQVVERSASKLGINVTEGAALLIGSRSRGTPRIANRLLERARDYAQWASLSTVTPSLAESALDLFGVDSEGLEHVDLEVLRALCARPGEAVGLATLASTVGEDTDTIETVQEPYLLRQGFIVKTPKGRMATDKAFAHLRTV